MIAMLLIQLPQFLQMVMEIDKNTLERYFASLTLTPGPIAAEIESFFNR